MGKIVLIPIVCLTLSGCAGFSAIEVGHGMKAGVFCVPYEKTNAVTVKSPNGMDDIPVTQIKYHCDLKEQAFWFNKVW